MKIAYFTVDPDFAKRFAKLLGKKDNTIIFEIFDFKFKIEKDIQTCAPEIEKFKSKVADFDLCIADFYEVCNDLKMDLILSKSDKLLTLSEHYNKIVAAYRRKQGINSPDVYNGKAKLLYFCSAGGGSGKTTLACGTAGDLCRFYDKRVLYLCMEPFDGSEAYWEVAERKKDIDEFLYALLMKKQVNLLDFLVTNRYGVFSFCPTGGKNPLYELTEEEMQFFLQELNEQGEFDYIICDGYLPFGKLEMMLMASAYKICVIDDGKNRYKFEKQFSYLKKGVYVEKDKIVMIRNFVPIEEESDDGAVCILNDKNCIRYFSKEKIEINTDVDLGSGIKKLCEIIA
ncbi:MAG: hypothetical protein ACTTH0_01220 [Eubacteriales bacterium]